MALLQHSRGSPWSPHLTTLLLFLFCSASLSAAQNQTTTSTTTSTTTPTTTTPIPTTQTPAPVPETILRHLQIVFRHGDRAPLVPLFPNDPFKESWPHGLDQLTTDGRARMFRLGQMIRAKYANYLGSDFSPREIFARSSAIDRCLESAQLVLAGKWQKIFKSYF